MATEHNHCILYRYRDRDQYFIKCNRCGAMQDLPSPLDVYNWLWTGDRFEAEHQHCQPINNGVTGLPIFAEAKHGD